MAGYNYQEGKERIESILDNVLEVIENDKIPSDDNFTFSNAYYGWVTGIFVDIRDSSELFSNGDKELISKMIRSFTSEIIEILRTDDNLREIGIRGDCVYAIYTTPYQKDILEIADKAFWINTFLKMLNKLLSERNMPTIRVGIGISTDKELVVKAGRKGVGINNSVWIGDAVTKASNLSSLGSKNGYAPIVMGDSVYDNIIKGLQEWNSSENVKSWFTERYTSDLGGFYDTNIIRVEFNEWIDSGML
jgi:class 3 adenylate cyclase